MVVHMYGLPVDMDSILAVADRHGLKLIEDAAEAHGQTYKGRPCGSFGDISTFSFYPNKLITTGEGGMIVTDDATTADRCRLLRNLGFNPKRRFVHEELGWNLRMTNMQAALGLAQLEQWDAHVRRKREIGKLYTKYLRNAPGVTLPVERMNYADNIYWVFGLVLEDSVRFDAQAMMAKLAEEKVGTRPFFWPMHEQPVFRRQGMFDGERYPVAERLGRRGFYVPSGLGITDANIERVATLLKDILA
jgi:perosamine synthetase